LESEIASELNKKTQDIKYQKDLQERKLKDEKDALQKEEERQRHEYQNKMKSIEEK